jgi:hypothetical protein
MTRIEAVTSSEPLVPSMPVLPTGFHSAWLTSPGEDCSSVVGSYRPQELVENANPGLNTGARCADLEAGTWLCRDTIDRGMTGTPPCLGAVSVPKGLVLIWGILGASESSPVNATIAAGVLTDTGAAVSPPMGSFTIAEPHGACLFMFPRTVNWDAGVFHVEGVAAPFIFDLLTAAKDVDVSALPACT